MNKYYTDINHSSINSNNMYELIFEHFFKYIEEQYYIKKEKSISEKTSSTHDSTQNNDRNVVLLKTYLSNEVQKWRKKRINFFINNYKYYDNQLQDYQLQDNYLLSQNFNDHVIYKNIVKNAEATSLQESYKAQEFIEEAKIKYKNKTSISKKNLPVLPMGHPKYKNQEFMNSEYNHDETVNYQNDIDIQNAMQYLHSNSTNHIYKEKKESNSESFILLNSPFLKDIDNSVAFHSNDLPTNQITITEQCQKKITDISQNFLDNTKSIIPYSSFENLKNDFTLFNLKSSINECFTSLIDFLKDISLLSTSNPHFQHESFQNPNSYIILFEKITYNHYLIKASYSNKIHQTNVYKDGCQIENFYPQITDDTIKVSLFYLEKILDILESIKEKPYKYIHNAQIPLSIISLNQYFSTHFNRIKNSSELQHGNIVPELFLINTLSEREKLNKNLEFEELKKNVEHQLTPIIHKEIQNELSQKFQEKIQQVTETVTIELEKKARINLDKLVMEKFMKIPSLIIDILPIQNRSFNTNDLVNALNGLYTPNPEKFNFDIEYPKYQREIQTSEITTSEQLKREKIRLNIQSKLHNNLQSRKRFL